MRARLVVGLCLVLGAVCGLALADGGEGRAVNSVIPPERLDLMARNHAAMHEWMAQEQQRLKAAGRNLLPGLGAFVPLASEALRGTGDPIPIPGRLAPGLHVFLPGPPKLGFGGTDHEPNTITNFIGAAAIGYLAGVGIGSDGVAYEMFHDMRVFYGNYVDSDGNHRRGVFAFI